MWLNLHHHIPIKDVRKLVWKLLSINDKFMIRCAHYRKRKPVFYSFFYHDCALKGYLNLLKWAQTQLKGKYNPNERVWNEWICASATAGGNLDVLKWCRANGFRWDSWTCDFAALGGHLEMLKWARENGCEWDSWTCAYAAKGGHLHVLKWARENGCEWNSYTCGNAAANKHLEVLQWAEENGCPKFDEREHDEYCYNWDEIYDDACEYGCPEHLRKLL